MSDSEYIQDEGDSVDLVVWEEYVDWVRCTIQDDWEIWVNSVGYTY